MSTATITTTATTVTVANTHNGAAFTLTGVYADVAKRILARDNA